MGPPQIRFVAKVQDALRTVFAIGEQPISFDLNIHITSGGRAYIADTLFDLVAVADETLYEECDRHITIHGSPKSANVNVIKKTLEFPHREPLSEVQVTTGIKRDDKFVPILFRVCGDPSRDRYLLPSGCPDELVPLADFDPSRDQLRFMVVASRRGTSFPQDKEHPSNVLERQFNHFTLTVIWSFFNRPSHAQAIDFFLKTKKETGPIRGFEGWEIYNLYTDLYMAHADEYFRAFPDRAN